jgi:hypothetical protein
MFSTADTMKALFLRERRQRRFPAGGVWEN